MAGLKILTPPTQEPLDLDLVKDALRIDRGDSTQDDHLLILIAAARETAEQATNRGLLTQTLRQYFDGFPGHRLLLGALASGYGEGVDNFGFGFASGFILHDDRFRRHDRLELVRSPLVSLTQVQYLDVTGATQTLDPAVYYQPDTDDATPASIYRNPAQCWPCASCKVNSVWIDYVVGYSDDGTKTPAVIKQAMLYLVQHWYDDPAMLQAANQSEIPFAATRLLSMKTVYYQP